MATATRRIEVLAADGLHARPAKDLVSAARASGAKITITLDDGRSADAASILAVLSLGVGPGVEVTVTADGDDPEAVIDGLVPFFSE